MKKKVSLLFLVLIPYFVFAQSRPDVSASNSDNINQLVLISDNIVKGVSIDHNYLKNILYSIDSIELSKIRDYKIIKKYYFCKFYYCVNNNNYKSAFNILPEWNYFRDTEMEGQVLKQIFEFLIKSYEKNNPQNSVNFYDFLKGYSSVSKVENNNFSELVNTPNSVDIYNYSSLDLKNIVQYDKSISIYDFIIKDSIEYDLKKIYSKIIENKYTIDSIEIYGYYQPVLKMKPIVMAKEMGQIYDLPCDVNSKTELFNILPGNTIKTTKLFTLVVLNYFYKKFNLAHYTKISLSSYKFSKIKIQFYVSKNY